MLWVWWREREREMENTKSAEAGPSSSGSLASAAEDKQGKLGDVTDKPEEEVCDDEGDEEDDDVDSGAGFAGFVPSPLVPLKQHIEKDKEDESLRRWKEKLLGCLESDLIDQMEPEVKFHSIGIVSDDVEETTTPLPVDESQTSHVLFTLREGSHYRLKLTFTVKYNIVSGLTYSNTVWKAGIRVDQSKGMLGTFAPQQEQYVHILDEETTPSGVLAWGLYSAKLKFEDDDRRCHMELKYSFEIKKSR